MTQFGHVIAKTQACFLMLLIGFAGIGAMANAM
jgi:hypothetical protein